jgi:micrococcal nuclease
MLSKREIRLIVYVIFLLSVALISFVNKDQVVPAENNFVGNFIVSRVIDGDTIELQNGEKVRYIGIDTPETIDPRKVVQCFGKEASAKNKELVEGKEVRLEKDISERDKYGRLLRYVYVGDVFVNEKLVAEGYAHAFTYPPDVKFSQLFLEKERLARENKLGLWGRCGEGEL